MPRNTLAGQGTDQIRSCLNRILFDDPQPGDGGAPDLDPFDLGDDLGEEDDTGSPPDQSPPPARASDPKARRPFDPHTYVEAVTRFRDAVTEHARSGSVHSREALRLRVLAMILVQRARRGDDPPNAGRLPCDDSNHGWPRLLLNLCAGFFHANPAPVSFLAMDERYNALPDDLLEAWVTSLWALGLAEACLKRSHPQSRLLRYFPTLRQTIALRTGLTKTDLASPTANRLVERLRTVFQSALGQSKLTIEVS